MPRKLSRARCPGLIGSKAHMAAYKRPVTVPVRERSTDRMPHHKHNLHFSLYSVRSKSSQISGKIEEQFQTLTVFRSSIQAEPMEFVLALRVSMVNLHHWASASAIQASDSSQKATNPNAITEARIREEKGKNSKVLNRWRRRRRITGLFPNFKKNQWKTESNQRILKIQIKSPNKARWKSKNLPLHTQEH